MIDCSEHYFLWESHTIKSPWIGFIHFVDNLPSNIYPQFETLSGLILSNTFQESLKYCLGLIVLSRNSAINLRKFQLGIPIKALLHPIGMSCVDIDIEQKSINNIVLLGQQYRKISTIFKLQTTKNKIWLPGMDPRSRRMKTMLQRENLDPISSNVTIKYVQSDEYKQILRESLVIIDLWDAAANNAVLDAISCATPILVRRLPAVVEYLGREYPLYFDELFDLNVFIERITIKDLQLAKDHIRSMNREKFTIDKFLSGLKSTVQFLASA